MSSLGHVRTFSVAAFLACWCATALPVRAQDPPSGPHPLELADVLAWKSIGRPAVSNDGRWLAYGLSARDADGELVVRETDGDEELRFPIGRSNNPGFAFAEDSDWLTFTIYPTREEAEADDGSRPENKAGLVHLETGEEVEFEKIRRFAFSGEASGWLALHRSASSESGPGDEDEGSDRAQGSDLLLYELATERVLSIGNVAEFAFNKSGEWLAFTVSTEDQVGNGVQARNMNTGVVLVLDSDRAAYRSLGWTEEGDAVALLKGKENDGFEEDLYSVLGFSDFSATGAEAVSYDPLEDEDFPADMTVSRNRGPLWTDDLSGILFGIASITPIESGDAEPGDPGSEEADEVAADGTEDAGDTDEDPERKEADDDLETADLVIWHYLDARLQSRQQVQETQDEDFSFLGIYRVAEDRFVRLADEDLREVRVEPDDRYGFGADIRPYELSGNLDGRRFQDIYAVDLETGARTLVAEQLRWPFGPNPRSDRFLYYRDGHFHVFDADSGAHRNITEDLPVSFIDTEDDHNVVDPPIPPRGWSEDGEFVLLHDNWDIWKVPVTGGAGTNLTGNGREEQIRYGRVHRLDPEDEGIDFSEPVYFDLYGEWTKKSGIARLRPGESRTETLLWEDAVFADLLKAKDADRYLYSRQTLSDYPDYYASSPELRDATRITEANPQQTDVLWSAGAMLIDYESEQGDRLQAALYLPAGYEPGETYSTIVFIYEKLSQGLNRYSLPVAYSFNRAAYTSNGYAVLEPDITYKVNDPGMSAVWSVLPALDAAIATGVVDEDRVGLHGHSWGGYQTAFLITQTDRFAAAVAGAPLTNLVSMYSSIYWNTGVPNQPIFESSQGRFSSGYWDNLDAYTRNSPVYYADRVTTPLLLLHNDKDGAVDWNQGIEYFNTLRRLQKPVVLLQYEGENHGLAREPNRQDYFVRMREFFDHHLLGAEAPDWLEEGVPRLELEDHLEERAKALRDDAG